LPNPYCFKEDGLFFSSKALGLVFSATFSPSGRLYEPEATSHFKKAHHLSYNDKNGQIFQSLIIID
jgi:hypothetical protein